MSFFFVCVCLAERSARMQRTRHAGRTEELVFIKKSQKYKHFPHTHIRLHAHSHTLTYSPTHTHTHTHTQLLSEAQGWPDCQVRQDGIFHHFKMAEQAKQAILKKSESSGCPHGWELHTPPHYQHCGGIIISSDSRGSYTQRNMATVVYHTQFFLNKHLYMWWWRLTSQCNTAIIGLSYWLGTAEG